MIGKQEDCVIRYSFGVETCSSCGTRIVNARGLCSSTSNDRVTFACPTSLLSTAMNEWRHLCSSVTGVHPHACHGRTIRVTSVYAMRATPYTYSYRVTGTHFPGSNI
jgi:hypothetical protein